MNYTSLSLAQTPPLAVPLRFFLTAPWFAAVAGLLLLLNGAETFAHRWTPALLGTTHLLTLGFLASVMVGAVQQLLPVLAGSPIPRPRAVSAALHLPLTGGALLFSLGLAFTQPTAIKAGAVLLGAALLLFLPVAGYSLLRARSGHATVRAMALAAASLGMALLLGLVFAGGWGWGLPLHRELTDVHAAWALLGWVGLLVAGVAYQVVPMFQITPQYPGWLTRGLAPAVFAGLLLWSAERGLGLLPGWTGAAALAWVVLALAAFAVTTLRVQQKRRRRLPDVTLDLWRLAMLALLAALLAGGLRAFGWDVPEPLAGALFIVGFAMSAVNGMLYKIVPFLVWLHLNNRFQAAGRWQGKVPNMKQVIDGRHARRQALLHAAAAVTLALATVWPLLTRPAGLLLFASSVYLGWNLFAALRLYRRLRPEPQQGQAVA